METNQITRWEVVERKLDLDQIFLPCCNTKFNENWVYCEYKDEKGETHKLYVIHLAAPCKCRNKIAGLRRFVTPEAIEDSENDLAAFVTNEIRDQITELLQRDS